MPRTLIALRFGAGLPYREIGKQMGLSEAAALMATRRALARLRKEIEPKETLE
jgi:DNA-directed RNA polymerase specialized sigma24 family protein